MIHVGPIHTRANPGKQRGLPKRVSARNTKDIDSAITSSILLQFTTTIRTVKYKD
jgi:hypothetical protein